MSTVTLEPESEIAEAIQQAANCGGEVTIRIGEYVYSTVVTQIADFEGTRPPNLLRERTPEEVERSLEGIRESAGAWRGLVDAEELKSYIRERRMTPGRGGYST